LKQICRRFRLGDCEQAIVSYLFNSAYSPNRQVKTPLIAAVVFALQSFAVASPSTLELKSGSTIKGELVSWDGEQATVKSDFGEVKLSKAQLSLSALSELALSSGDSSALKAKIKELQSTVESLRRDNEALRDQLASSTPQATSPTVPATIPSSSLGVSSGSSAAPTSGGFWISSTGKRHNANCRYYQTSRGRPGSSGEGVACKICGG
jgi:hypothetical protein